MYIVLLKLINLLYGNYSHKEAFVISNNVEVINAVDSCISRYEGAKCTTRKYSLHHNSIITFLKGYYLTRVVHEFALFAPYSDSAFCKMEQERRLIGLGKATFPPLHGGLISSLLHPQVPFSNFM